MKKYLQRVMFGGAVREGFISTRNRDSIIDIVDSEINSSELKYEMPKYIVMNSTAYSSFCSAISNLENLEKIRHVEKYKDLSVIVIPPADPHVDKYNTRVYVVPEASNFNNGIFFSEGYQRYKDEITGKDYEEI